MALTPISQVIEALDNIRGALDIYPYFDDLRDRDWLILEEGAPHSTEYLTDTWSLAVCIPQAASNEYPE